jgi:hypothetical protein
VRYFLSALVLGLSLTGAVLCQNSGQTKQPSPSTVKTVAQGYHIAHPEPDELRPTTATPAQTTAKSTKKKSSKKKY